MLSTVQEKIEQHQVIAILRNVPPDRLNKVMDALYAGGVRLAEITLNSEGALSGIASMRKAFQGRMLIGAGTVMNREDAKEAMEAGAEFLISPHVSEAVIETALARDVLPLPGAMTPTEIVRAMEAGSKYVKLFPCSFFGPGYVKEILAPLNQAKIIAVGGVNALNAAEYIRNGAVGVGLGSSLVTMKDILAGDFETIERNTAKMIQSLSGD
jgi:2-dehydro-3-deoxyphosphogluconate aldolase/(4S)-4-hydroxy-2-oxoglutarate aldolase